MGIDWAVRGGIVKIGDINNWNLWKRETVIVPESVLSFNNSTPAMYFG